MTWVFIVLGGLTGLITVGTLLGGLWGYRMVLVRTKKDFEDPAPDDPMNEHFIEATKAGREYLFSLQPEDVQIKSRDGLTLRGWYIPAAKPTNKMIVFSHGFVIDGVTNFACAIKGFHESFGWNILLPDHRSHGRSDGRYIGFSALEWQDLFDWCEAFKGRLGDDPLVALNGVSMGANVVLNLNAHNPPSYVKCVVADCPFTCGYEMITLSAKRDMHINYPPAFWAMAMWYRLFTGKSLRHDTDTYGMIGQLKLPTLFVHGEADPFVPAEMGHRLYEAARVEKDCLFVDGAGHGFSYLVDPQAYTAKMEAFFGKYVVSEKERASV